MEWRWFPRALEAEMLSLVEHNVEASIPTWLYVRGRRQTGKTQTVKALLEACRRELGLSTEYILMTPYNTEALAPSFGLPLTATLYECAEELRRRIMEGSLVVIDRVELCSEHLQSLLQHVIDGVKGVVLAAPHRVTGGLILLGSKPAAADAVVEGCGRPLWHRLTESVTILPFSPSEMTGVFRHFGIESSRQKVLVLLLTGSYPAALECLARVGHLSDDASLDGIVHCLMQGGYHDVLSEEFDAAWFQVAKEAVRGIDIERTSVSDPGRTRMLSQLDEQYGVIRPACSSSGALLGDHYEIWDARWLWSDAVAASEPISQSSTLAAVAERFMGRLVKDAIQARSGLGIPSIPAWRPAADGSREEWHARHSVNSTPALLDGRLLEGSSPELDAVCAFVPERHIVYVSCKLEPKGLGEKFVRVFLTGAAAGGASPVPDTVALIADPTTATSYVFCLCGLNEERARGFMACVPVEDRSNVWVADFNDFWDFSGHSSPAHPPPLHFAGGIASREGRTVAVQSRATEVAAAVQRPEVAPAEQLAELTDLARQQLDVLNALTLQQAQLAALLADRQGTKRCEIQ